MSARPLTFTIGLNYDNVEERRKSWSNNFGVKGELGRDEDNTVFNFDQFAQAEWLLSDRCSVSGGLRHSVVKFESKDYFVTGTNPDDSSSLEYSKTTPVVGTVFKVNPVFNLYANYGEGFETPTYAELAYASSDGSVTGLNYDLKASTSDNYEIGAKAFLGAYTRVNAAFFFDRYQERGSGIHQLARSRRVSEYRRYHSGGFRTDGRPRVREWFSRIA